MNTKLIDKILSEVSLDPRVKNGTFSIEEDAHMAVLREYLVNRGIDEASAVEFSNKVLEGKYPERQAYNKNGILVTFPTPEYKKNAIKAGTHFEEDPTKGQSNLFQGGGGAKKQEEPKPTAPAASEPKTQLPVSQAADPQDDPNADKDTTPAPQPKTTAAPMPAPEQPSSPAPEQPTELPPPQPKSPQEKEADKDAIKTMLKGDDYMLERIVEWFIYNAPDYLKEQVEDHRKKYVR